MEAVEEKSYASSAVGNTGLTLGAVALGLTVLQNGGLGGILGNNRPPAGDPPWSRDMGYERDLTTKDMQIGKLEAQLYTDQKVNELRQELQAGTAAQAVINAQQTSMLAVLQNQVQVLNSMTSPYIRQPIMAASEAALSSFKTATTASASATNAG